MSERKPQGELAELKLVLANLCTVGKKTEVEQRSAKRDVFRKVITYMTLGMDMKGLFPTMTSAANLSPNDIVLKKMLYLYITHYAAQTPDLALLAVNQLTKDFHDQDPTGAGAVQQQHMLQTHKQQRTHNMLSPFTNNCLATNLHMLSLSVDLLLLLLSTLADQP